MNPKTLPLKIFLRRLIWVCLTPSAIVITLLALALAERLQSERTDQLTAYAKSLAANLDAEILTHIHGLQALSSGAPKLNGPDSYAQWHKRLTAYDATFNAPVLIADNQRRTLIHSREPLGNLLPAVAEPKGRSALSEALSTGQPAVGDVVTGAVLKQLMVAVAVPISSGGPELFAMSLIPVAQFTQSLQAKPPPVGWKVRLRDSVGTVIAPYGEPPIPEPSLLERPRYIKVALAQSPWTLEVSVDFSEFYKYRLPLLWLILLGAAATVAGAAWAARSLKVSLSTSIKRMSNELQKDTPKEISTVGVEATLIAEIENARQEMQRLELAKIDAQENERRRIARELHDGLQQDLAALRLHLSLISGSEEVTPQELRRFYVKASALAKGSIQELHRIVKDLRPWLLEQLGILEALEKLVDGYRQTSDLQIEVEVIGDEAAYADLRISIASCLFRVTQECLTNAVKHAQAEFVHIVLDYSDTTMIVLQVSDDGVGITFHDHHKPQTLGLRGMAERVESLGGSLEISRRHQDDSQSGTTIKAVIPT